MVIAKLRLQNYKGFKDFTATFGPSAVLVGPNNAGKSTLIGALRLTAAASRLACRSKATTGGQDGERWVFGHPLHLATRSGFVAENVRHEFEEKTARIEVTFSSKAVLRAIWPVDSEEFFWIEHPKGMQVTTAAKAKLAFLNRRDTYADAN